ncbi:MAG: mechanosensitive ion channel domain-containing protein [Bacteroidia bacterium]
MENYRIQIIESLLIVVVYVVLYFINKTIVNNFLKKASLEKGRRKMAIRTAQLFTTLAAVILLTGVWGFQQNEILVFVSTVLTALGIAFFAQWSLLSNITSSIILFFNHPLKIGNHLKVLDKDCPFEGEITELTYFFVHLKTKNGELITIPNSLVLQKSISIKENKNE